jgi:hypothetical protein
MSSGSTPTTPALSGTTISGIADPVHCVLADVHYTIFSQRNHDHPPNGERTGYQHLALTFGTLLSSQGTDASFKTLSPVSPGASFSSLHFIRTSFRTLADRFRSAFRPPGPFPARSDEWNTSGIPQCKPIPPLSR